jgi:dolichyl-phosphate beta-glucosyltransferase
VSIVPSAAPPALVAPRRPARAPTWLPWLVVACYLAGAIAVTGRLWADPASLAQAGDPADVDLFAWFMHYDAAAVAHGHLPALVTAAMNAPRGINLMWNTSVLLPGILLAPVTLLAGPQVSLTVMLTLGIAGSAAALFWVLRRWGASLGAAALGGAVYGFSPAIVNSGIGHYHLEFAVLPPLIIDALLRVVTGRGNPLRTGLWLGLLTAAQLFTGEELLADTALAGLILVTVVVATAPRCRVKAKDVGLGLASGAAVALVICARPLWAQLYGPLAQHNIPAGADPITNKPAFFVEAPGNLLFHTAGSAASAAAYGRGLAEYLGYLGWPLLVVLTAAAIRFWRDPKIRAAGLTWAVLEILSLGGSTLSDGSLRYPGALLPFHYLQGAPLFSQALPDRLSILADGAAGAVLAFALGRARSAVLASGGRRPQTPPSAAPWTRAVPGLVAIAAVLPLVPLPYQPAPVADVPAGWQAAFARLHLAAGARVLVVPVGSDRRPQALRWQADTGEPRLMIGGYFIGPNQAGQQMIYISGPATTAAQYLDGLWNGPPRAGSLPPGLLRSDFAYWRPAAVVAVTSPASRLGHYLAALLGPPDDKIGDVLAWRRPAGSEPGTWPLRPPGHRHARLATSRHR